MNDSIINGVEKRFAKENIIYIRIDDFNIDKKYYDLNGNLKRSKSIKSREQDLITRKARNTQDLFINLIHNFGYSEV